jgi:hypothetical protein
MIDEGLKEIMIMSAQRSASCPHVKHQENAA